MDKPTRRQRLKEWFPSGADLWLFVRICAWSALLPALLRLLSLPRLLALLTPAAVPPSPSFPDPTADRIDGYICRVLKLNPQNLGRACLRRSLLLYRFFREQGIPARFYIGVRQAAGSLQGHSWIELQGEHYRDSQADIKYAVTFSYPPATG